MSLGKVGVSTARSDGRCEVSTAAMASCAGTSGTDTADGAASATGRSACAVGTITSIRGGGDVGGGESFGGLSSSSIADLNLLASSSSKRTGLSIVA